MRQIFAFFEIVLDVWKQGFLGIDIGKIIVSAFIFALFFALRNKITNIILFHAEKLADKLNSKTALKVINSIKSPLKMIPVVLGTFLAFDYLDLDEGGLKTIADRTIRTLIVCNIFWIFYVTISPLAKLFDPLKNIFTAEIVEWIIKTIKFLVVFFNIATVLEIWESMLEL